MKELLAARDLKLKELLAARDRLVAALGGGDNQRCEALNTLLEIEVYLAAERQRKRRHSETKS